MRVESVTPSRPQEEAVQRRQQPPRTEAPESARHEAKNEAKRDEPRAVQSLEQELTAAIELVNRVLQTRNRSFEFSVHEPTKEIIVRVIDTKSNEVVKEIPPEEILDLVAKLWEMAGLFVDERR
ncbi:flagellar protein FlaG [Thermodesulfitimonas autotrophica]|uniref:flagellar protein FlaG n=1 Tax=Thermodesulfitimonas autotrophica TaxID=1894989 RepID=UPI002FE029DE